MRALLLHSPSAGNGGLPEDELLALFRREGFEPSLCSVKDPGFADALCEPTDLIVAAGGDGTVATVLTRMPDRAVPVAILPRGTANNIARSLGIAAPPEQIVAGLRDAIAKRFNIGIATGPWGRRRFVEAIGIGLLTRAMAEIHEADLSGADQLQSSREEFSRLLAAAEPECVDATVDGVALTGDFLIFEVMNVGAVGPCMHLAPLADPGDGLLDVVYAPASRRAEMQEWVDAGPERSAPPVDVVQARKVELSRAGALLRIGDDFLPSEGVAGGVTIELEPDPAWILVPPAASIKDGA